MLQYFILGNMYDDVLLSPQNMFLSPSKITSTPISLNKINEETHKLKFVNSPPSSFNKRPFISPPPINSNKKDESKINDSWKSINILFLIY